MLQKSETSKKLRLPPPHGGVNVNFCKNPLCVNFGRPAEIEDRRGKRRGNDVSAYRVSGSDGGSSLFCEACGISSKVKSNLACWEELERSLESLAIPSGHHCQNHSCPNFFKPLEIHPEEYARHGMTAKGDPRLKCKKCTKTFSVGRPHRRQRTSHENKTVFQMLVGKVCLSKISEITGLAPKTVYDKVDFLYDQCRKFVASRESRLPEMKFRKLRIATDMQDYMVNWPNKAMRKTIQFRALASSCLDSGYVLACHPQIDSRFDTNQIQDAIVESGDLRQRPAFRQYARLWSYEDYASCLSLDADTFRPARDDQDGPEHMTPDRQLPRQSALVHIDYLMFGHFMYLEYLVGRGARHTLFSLDGDPGLANACLASWKQQCRDRKLDVAILTCNKSATIDEKNHAVTEALKLKQLADAEYPSLHPVDAWKTWFTANSVLATRTGMDRAEYLRRHDVPYPFIKKSEPGKRVRLLTDDGTRPALEIADLFHDVSLHQVDRFFMQVRRSIAGLERAPSYPRRASRKWYLYGFYSPEMVEKTLTIYRTYFNFIAKGKDGKTPAMRIGLAKGPVRFEDVIYTH
jgi:transposase-like protein